VTSNTQPSIIVVAETAGARRRAAEHVREIGTLSLQPSIDEPLPDDRTTVVVLVCRDFRKPEAALTRRVVTQIAGARVVVVVVASTPDAQRIRRALEAGASAFVNETEAEQALAPAVLAALTRQICIPEGFRRHVTKPVLTTREKQILGMVVMGLSNGEISRQLYLAESTVKSHLSGAFSKLGVRSRNEATALILDPAFGLGTGILRITEDRVIPRLRSRGP
jgi:DNA-binding NarL/FixJ family response regulator